MWPTTWNTRPEYCRTATSAPTPRSCRDPRPRTEERGLAGLDRIYPTACELLVRDFIVRSRPQLTQDLGELPRERFFRDVGWVSMHSALGRPEDDIQITFKSSPYGSFSHSHADQNAYILNAFGESLAINSAYREYHRSPLHKEWTWQTKSKNALLIDGQGQKPQDKLATGKITRFEVTDRCVWTTGDTTAAYETLQPADRVVRVTRDLVFVDRRYLVLRDRVRLATPARISWLLHAEKNLSWDAAAGTAVIRGDRASLIARVLAIEVTWSASVTDQFPAAVDPKYTSGEAGASYVTAKWSNQGHLTLESAEAGRDFTVIAVPWPDRSAVSKLPVTLDAGGTLVVTRPDRKRDSVRVRDETCEVSSALPDAE